MQVYFRRVLNLLKLKILVATIITTVIIRTAKYNVVEFGLFFYKTRMLDKFLYGF